MKKLVCSILALFMIFVSATSFAEEWECPNCGNKVTGNFCNNCGTAKPSDEWICPNCGQTVTGNFCSNCGTAKVALDVDAVEEEASAVGEQSAEDPIDEETTTEQPASITDEEEKSTDSPKNNNESEIVQSGDGYAVNKLYTWSTRWGNYCALVLKNTSEEATGFDLQIVYYDSSDNIVGVSNPSISVLDPGYEVLVSSSCDTAFDHLEFSVTPTDSWYNDVHTYVDVTAQIVGDKAILTATNTGNVNASFIEYRCLFLDSNDEVVESAWGYIVDNDSELKSGKTERRQESCSEKFDKVLVYFEGRTSKSVINTGTVEIGAEEETSDEYEVTKEYTWNTKWNNYFGVAVKNTSGEDCGFDAQVIFYDKDENIIGVSNPSATVCGDGDTAFDHVSYTINKTSSWYADVHSYVDVTASVSGKKAILTGKNNGDKEAKFVEYRALFLDKDGNAVDYAWGYLTDNDSAIKPGKMELREEQTSSL